MDEAVFPIESRRFERAKRAQTAQHLLVAVTLLFNAWPRLSSGHDEHRMLTILELAGAAVMIGAVIVERVRARHSHGIHSSIGWVELAGALMTLAEAVGRLYEPHTIAFRIVSFIPPMILFAFAFLDLRIRSVPNMKATDEQFTLRTGVLWKHSVPLANAQSFVIGDKSIDVEYADGSVRHIKLRDVKNRDEALAWATDQLVQRGLTAK